MLCYKDITFCQNDCQNNMCKIRLTHQIMSDAAKWWGKKNAPIATADLKNECNDYIPLGGSNGTTLKTDKRHS